MFACILITWVSILTPGLAADTIPEPDQDGKYTIESVGIKASFVPFSAAVANLWVADRNGTMRDIVLGYDTDGDYITDDFFGTNYGAIPGRYSNRIANATYVLDGQRYYTDRNAGNSTIHSGANGWSHRNWTVSQVSSDSLTFSIYDSDNSSAGMPGDVAGNVTYTVGPNTWGIKIEARALTHRTPLMLTNHAYWNLDAFANPDGDNTVLNHTLSFPFSRRLIAWDSSAQANGSILDIARYDIADFWSAPKAVGANSSAPGWNGIGGVGFGGYDNGWTVDCPASGTKAPSSWRDQPIASLSSSWSGIRWDLYSNQEGVVMTSCGFFPGGILPLKKTQMGATNDGFVQPFGCIAVEAQDWVDGINHPEWGREDKQIFGQDDGTYVNEIIYEFSVE